jgi:6-phosphogluconolactonase
MADTDLALLGTFTEAGTDGLYAVRVDDEGRVDTVDAVDGGANPSFFAFHPEEALVYAANNTETGGVTTLRLDPASGELTTLGHATIGESGPCYCTVDADGEYLVTANGSGGSVALLPVSGPDVGEPTDVVDHAASPDDAHPHCVVFGPEGRFVYVPDRNTDELLAYELDREAGRLRPGPDPVTLDPGSGPRHLDVHPNGRWLYLINERESTLVAFERDPETGALDRIGTEETLPDAFDGENYPADVHVHPAGQWVYASNRGHDSVARFELDEEGRPRFAGAVSTRGEWPRNFALGPRGDLLIAENQHTEDVVPFTLDGDGRPQATGHAAAFPTPVCWKFY